jgi:hypothetical protein
MEQMGLFGVTSVNDLAAESYAPLLAAIKAQAEE